MARLTHATVVENLRALGFVRVVADGVPLHLDELAARLDLTRVEELLVLVDRLEAGPAAASRLAEALGTAFQEGEGVAIVLHGQDPTGRTPVHRVPRLQQLRHAGGRGHPGTLFLQQPPGRLLQLQRFRGGPRVR